MPKPKPADTHKQCKLRRVNGTITHSWIPSKFAVKGKYLKLKNDDGEWENGWCVEEVWGTRKSIDVLKDAEGYKKQRERTDGYREADEDGGTTWSRPTG